MKLQKADFSEKGKYPIIDQSQNDISGWTDDKDAVIDEGKPLVIFGDHTCAVKYVDKPFVQGADGIKILKTDDRLLPKFLFYLLKATPIVSDGYKRHFSKLKETKILLPPLEVQEKIVAEIDGYQKIIDGVRQIVENYKPTIKINPAWPVVELSELVSINENTIDPVKEYGQKEFCYIDITSVENGTGEMSFDNKIKGIDAPSRARRKVSKGDVLLSTVRPNLKAFAYLTDIPDNSIASTGFAVLSPTEKVVGQYIYYLLFDDFLQKQMIERMGKGAYPSINQSDVEHLKIPLAPIGEQKRIAEEIESEQKIVNENKKLIEIFEKKISDTISALWA